MLSLSCKSKRAGNRGRRFLGLRTPGNTPPHQQSQQRLHFNHSSDFRLNSALQQQRSRNDVFAAIEQRHQSKKPLQASSRGPPELKSESIRANEGKSDSGQKKKAPNCGPSNKGAVAEVGGSKEGCASKGCREVGRKREIGEGQGTENGTNHLKRRRMCSKTKLNSVKDESTGKEHKPSDRTKAGGEDTHAQERRDISNRAQPAQDCSTKRQQQTQQDENATKLQLVKQFACRAAAVGASATATRDRLQGGRFRHLNEFLYTNKGEAAFAEYQREPELFDIYHAGYRAQVRRWPLNPLDIVADWLATKPKEWIIGDFGCGEAALALRFSERTFHSFDLVAANERITACDISSVPLANASLNVAIFCLSLMGRDWPAFLREAHRLLRPRGILIIVEVSSRILSLADFVAAIESLGFKSVKQRRAYVSYAFLPIQRDLASFFVLLEFSQENKKSKTGTRLSPNLLQPCLYKRR